MRENLTKGYRIDRPDRRNVEQASGVPVTTGKRFPYPLTSPHARTDSSEIQNVPDSHRLKPFFRGTTFWSVARPLPTLFSLQNVHQ